jgi:hypothetical protein
MPTGKAVAAGGEVGGAVAGGGVALGAATVLVSEAISVEVARAGRGVSLGGGLLGGGVPLAASGVGVAEAGAQTLGVAVKIAMAVADGAADVAGAAVAVMSAGVGVRGASVPTIQPEHTSAAIRSRLPSLRRSISSL